MNQKNMIFNADDLGMSLEIDNAILSAADCGFIQSASVSVVNGLDFDQFKKFLNVAQPLQLGLHINLTEGRPILATSATERLVDTQGVFKSALHLFSDEKYLREDVLYAEMKAQLNRFAELSGTMPNHIDSHQHYTYLSPVAFSAFLKLAKSENLKIRNPLSFINESRLQRLIESVKQRYGIEVPFFADKRSQELRKIFKHSQAEIRTDDCLIEIPSNKRLVEALQVTEGLEIVCHPHNHTDLEKLKLLQQELSHIWH